MANSIKERINRIIETGFTRENTAKPIPKNKIEKKRAKIECHQVLFFFVFNSDLIFITFAVFSHLMNKKQQISLLLLRFIRLFLLLQLFLQLFLLFLRRFQILLFLLFREVCRFPSKIQTVLR